MLELVGNTEDQFSPDAAHLRCNDIFSISVQMPHEQWHVDLPALLYEQQNEKTSFYCTADQLYTDWPGPLYNTVLYSMILDITLIIVGPQLDYFCYIFYTYYINSGWIDKHGNWL